jgi:ribose transport system permease protein
MAQIHNEKQSLRPAVDLGGVGAVLRRLAQTEALALIVALLLLMVIFSIASPHFMTVANMLNIGRSVAIMGIAAAGVTVGLIGGVFDLSIATVADLSAVVTGLANLRFGIPPVPAMGIGLLVGLTCGAINGIIVTRFRINPIIATLGTAGVFRGIAFLLTEGQSHVISGAGFEWLGRTRLSGIPSSLIVMLLVMIVAYVILSHTRFGRNTYAIGGNPVASRLAGINVDRQRLMLFMFVSFFASFSGLVLLSKLGTMIPNASAGTELDIIAAAILGGTALSGGGGTIQGTLVGVLILGTLRNGLIVNNINAYYQQVASGIALITAVAIDRLRSGGYR